MAILEYNGKAKDHEVVPEKLRIGEDGKPMKRKIVKPAKLIHKELVVYNLRGMLFPAGKPLRVKDVSVIKKAVSLGCFKVEVEPGEPLSHDKKYLKEIQAKVDPDKFVVLDKRRKLEAEPEQHKAVVHEYAEDTYDSLDRSELMRIASSRGVSIDISMKKVEIIELLRAQEAPARAEMKSEFVDVG